MVSFPWAMWSGWQKATCAEPQPERFAPVWPQAARPGHVEAVWEFGSCKAFALLGWTGRISTVLILGGQTGSCPSSSRPVRVCCCSLALVCRPLPARAGLDLVATLGLAFLAARVALPSLHTAEGAVQGGW